MILQLDFSAERIRHLLLSLGCFLLLCYFALPSIVGERGVIAGARIEAQLSASQSELARLQEQRMALEARTRLLRPDNLDLDMLDERARATLGITRPNEYVIYFDQPDSAPSPAP